MTDSAIKVGDTLYMFDVNRRRYKDPGTFGGGGIVYAEHFVPYEISGETSKSWLVNEYGRTRKVSKAGLTESSRYGPIAWYSAAGMADDIWLHENRNAIVESIRKCQDVSTLKRIAELLKAPS